MTKKTTTTQLTTFRVLVSCTGGDETFTVKAKTQRAAEFDALRAAERAFPFASDFNVERVDAQ